MILKMVAGTEKAVVAIGGVLLGVWLATAILLWGCLPIGVAERPGAVALTIEPQAAEGLLLLFQREEGGYERWSDDDGLKRRRTLLWHRQLGATVLQPPPMRVRGLWLVPLDANVVQSQERAELLVLARGYQPQWVSMFRAYQTEEPNALKVTLVAEPRIPERISDLLGFWDWFDRRRYSSRSEIHWAFRERVELSELQSDVAVAPQDRVALHRFVCSEVELAIAEAQRGDVEAGLRTRVQRACDGITGPGGDV